MTALETTATPGFAEPIAARDDTSFVEVYSDALRGEACTVHGDFLAQLLPVHEWVRTVSHADRVLLSHCRGATLDVGCGPGRMGAHLARRGHDVLGLDLVREAVEQTRRRGVPALQGDVFDPLPGEGHWDTVLLADGNIGIGGAPAELLRRAAQVIGPRGRVVCDLAPPGTGVWCHDAWLVTVRKRSRPFPWARVGPEAIASLAAGAALGVVELGHHRGRWFAVMAR